MISPNIDLLVIVIIVCVMYGVSWYYWIPLGEECKKASAGISNELYCTEEERDNKNKAFYWLYGGSVLLFVGIVYRMWIWATDIPIPEEFIRVRSR